MPMPLTDAVRPMTTPKDDPLMDSPPSGRSRKSLPETSADRNMAVSVGLLAAYYFNGLESYFLTSNTGIWREIMQDLPRNTGKLVPARKAGVDYGEHERIKAAADGQTPPAMKVRGRCW